MEPKVQRLIAAANDARHCLASITDAMMYGTVLKTIAELDAAIAQFPPLLPFCPSLADPIRPDRPFSSKEQFMDMREAEQGIVAGRTNADGWPY